MNFSVQTYQSYKNNILSKWIRILFSNYYFKNTSGGHRTGMFFIVLSWLGILKALTEMCWSELQEKDPVLGLEAELLRFHAPEVWGHGRAAEEFQMSQSGVKYQDKDGKEGPWWFKCRIFFFWSTSPSRTETNCILGQCLMRFLTAGCGWGGGGLPAGACCCLCWRKWNRCHF